MAGGGDGKLMLPDVSQTLRADYVYRVKFNFQAIIRHRTKMFSWTSPVPLQFRLRKRFSRDRGQAG